MSARRRGTESEAWGPLSGRDAGFGFDGGRDTGRGLGFDGGRDTGGGWAFGFDGGRDTGLGFDGGRDTGGGWAFGFDGGRDTGRGFALSGRGRYPGFSSPSTSDGPEGGRGFFFGAPTRPEPIGGGGLTPPVFFAFARI